MGNKKKVADCSALIDLRRPLCPIIMFLSVWNQFKITVIEVAYCHKNLCGKKYYDV